MGKDDGLNLGMSRINGLMQVYSSAGALPLLIGIALHQHQIVDP